MMLPLLPLLPLFSSIPSVSLILLNATTLLLCRDPKWFRVILNYLRDGYVPLPPTWHERRELRQVR